MPFRKYDTAIKLKAVQMRQAGHSLADINSILGLTISDDSMARWKALYISTSPVVRDPADYLPRGPVPVITEDGLATLGAIVETNPCLYVDEIQHTFSDQTNVHLSRPTITRALRDKLGLSLKSTRTVHPRQCPLKPGQYCVAIADVPPSSLVFLDETAVCFQSVQRYRGRARVGLRTSRVTQSRKGLRFTLLPAISSEGLIAEMVQEGTFCRLDFLYFLEHRLLPVMNAWPDTNSVLVLDNAPIHKGTKVQDLCDLFGVRLIYLPPYSPDYNPIKKVFSVFKAQLRRVQWLTGRRSDHSRIAQSAHTIMTGPLCCKMFKACGYFQSYFDEE